jgi:hypothetical protein
MFWLGKWKMFSLAGFYIWVISVCYIKRKETNVLLCCFRCQLVDGTELVEGDFRYMENNAIPQSTDIVFIIEAKDCNRNIKDKRNMDSLTSVLLKELTDQKIIANR